MAGPGERVEPPTARRAWAPGQGGGRLSPQGALDVCVGGEWSFGLKPVEMSFAVGAVPEKSKWMLGCVPEPISGGILAKTTSPAPSSALTCSP